MSRILNPYVFGIVCGPETNVFDVTGGTISSIDSFHTYSIRQVVDTISTGGNQIRARFYASTTATKTLVLKHASVGIRSGSTVNTTATPTELTFDEGASGVTIGTGLDAWSDWVDFDSSASDDLLVIHDISDTDGQGALRRSSMTTPGRYSKESAESWNVASPTGFSSLIANIADGMFQVEVRTCS